MTQQELIDKRIQEFFERGDHYLDLSWLSLTEIPPQITELQGLLKLNLSRNNLGKSGLERINQLYDLKELNLNHNSLLDEDLVVLADIESLTHLNLSRNNITGSGLKFLSGLHKINNLNVSKNLINGDGIDIISQKDSIRTLDLSYNRIDSGSIINLSNLVELQKLDLSYNKVDALSLASIRGLSSLATLKLSFNALGHMEFGLFGEFRGLQHLELNGNQLGDRGLQCLSGLSELKSLHLRGNGIERLDHNIFNQLSSLRVLDLSDNRINSRHVDVLTELRNIENLNLSFNNLEFLGAYFFSYLEKISSLDLSANRLGDNSIDGIKSLRSLRDLRISDNVFKNFIKVDSEQLANLESLSISRNYLEDLSVDDISSIKSLKKLNIFSNKITDNGIRIIVRELTNLNSIDCRGNLTESIPSDILKNIRALRSYFVLQEDDKVLNTKAKVILTGNPSSGKSTLVSWLIGRNIDFDKSAPTHGMSINEWKVSDNLQIRFWDFGGQDYYHATHSLFMNDTMLHLCLHTNVNKPIVPGRESDLQFPASYWLGNISYYTHGFESIIDYNPVWLLDTHSDLDDFRKTRITDLADSPLEVQEHYTISTKIPNKGLDRFREDLVDMLQKNMAKFRLDNAWITVRDKYLVEWRTSGLWYLSSSDFKSKCQQCDFRFNDDDGRYLGLLDFLVRTGEVLILRIPSINDKSIVFLSPILLIDKIYQVLSEEKISNGVLKIPDENDPDHDDISIIIDLLAYNDLIFEDKNIEEGRYIVPQYLPDNIYSSHFTKLIPLTLVLKYEGYMPLSLIPSFITRFASRSSESYYWKYGAFFSRHTLNDSLSAFVRVDINQLKVYMHIESKRGSLELIRDIVAHFWQRPESKPKKDILELADIAHDYITAYVNISDPKYNDEDISISTRQFIYKRNASLIPKLHVALEDVNFGDIDAIVRAIHHSSKHYPSSDGRLIPLQPIHYQLFGGSEFRMPKNIFLSYAHADESSKDQLDRHFEALRKSGKIETWHDRRIHPGDKFDPTIKAAMEKADIFLLLISVDFMNSRYIWNEEIKYAVDNKRKIIPIFLHPCDFVETEYGIGENQGIPRDKGKGIRWVHSSHWQYPQEAYLEIVNEIKALL